jgi:hypothetical protein
VTAYDEVTCRLQEQAQRQQETWRREQHERETLDLQRRQTAALERQSSGGQGILGLLLLVAVVAGVAYVLVSLSRFVWRLMTGRTRSEWELLRTVRRHVVSASDVRRGVEEIVRRRGSR